jgi:hypothetical protein
MERLARRHGAGAPCPAEEEEQWERARVWRKLKEQFDGAQEAGQIVPGCCIWGEVKMKKETKKT